MYAALHNLREVRQELIITKRDRDRNTEGLEVQYERYRKLELNLTAEKEKSRTLEAQLDRSEDWVIEEYKKSSIFNKLLDDEYDSNFPGTFSTCWKEIILEVGKKVSRVDLNSFHVPFLSVAEGSPVAATSEVQTPSSSRVIDDFTLSPPKEALEIPLITPGTKIDPFRG